ncbi:MAG: glycosyltransferase family 2 protein [Chloroflexota bacterium]
MTRPIPDEVMDAARARGRAREARDFAEADRLRAQIEAAGWKIVDRGSAFSLSRATPPDVEETGRIRYGASRNVPSRLDDAPVGVASVVVVATDWPEDLERTLSSLREHGPDATQVIIAADDPSPEQAAALDALEVLESGRPGVATEVVWTSQRLGQAAALNAAIRRAEAPVVVVLDSSVELTGDAIGPLAGALPDPSIAIVGPWGLVSRDLRQFEDGPTGDVDAVAGYAMAFRRDDYRDRGPLDERFRFYRNLDIWWSLVLRDQGDDRPPRRALALDALPFVRHEHRGWASLPESDRNRQSKRNFYRIIDRFGSRRDLLVGPAER